MTEPGILYRESLRRSEWSLALLVIYTLGIAAVAAMRESVGVAVLFGVAAAVVVAVRLVRGPLRGPRMIEVGPSEIVIRQPTYIPTRTERVPLDRVTALEIAGGKGDRHFRFKLDDGSVQEIRPRYGFFEPTAIEFLVSNLPDRVTVVEEPPANWLARAHGNF